MSIPSSGGTDEGKDEVAHLQEAYPEGERHVLLGLLGSKLPDL